MEFNPSTQIYSLPILRRANDGCVVCDTSTTLVCPPTCATGTECKFGSQTCQECPTSFCAPTQDTKTATANASNKPSTTAIVGGVVGVVGGVAVIGLVTYLVWKYYVKSKRQSGDYDPANKSVWADDEEGTAIPHSSPSGGGALGVGPNGEKAPSMGPRHNPRASTHTVHSIASTVLTRASNIIQIAYIPGVTNRAGTTGNVPQTPTSAPGSPSVLVPPVPPIPMQVGSTSGSLSGNSTTSAANSPTTYEAPHFFVPGDLRDSTYSGFSAYSDRTSFARTSYAARSSIASTMYNGKHAVISQAGVGTTRLKPAIVSVRSTGSSGTGPGGSQATPPMPSIDFEKYGLGVPQVPGSGSPTLGRPTSRAESTFSVGSTFLQNATGSVAMAGKAQVVRVGSGASAGQQPGKSAATAAGSSNSKLSSVTATGDDDETAATTPGSGSADNSVEVPLITVRDSAAVTLIDDASPQVDQGPFSDPPASPTRGPSHGSTGSLSAVIEEATRKAATAKAAAVANADNRRSRLDPGAPAGSSEREGSPFADEHAVRD